MDNNAVDQIVDLAQQSKLDLTDQHTPAIVISDGCSVKDLEHLLPNPVHFRAQLNTRFIEQFSTYVNDNKGAKVFVDESRLRAEGIFDMGSTPKPEWGKHRANLVLVPEVDYRAVLENNKSRMEQQEIIDFVEDWAENIEFYSDNGESIHIKDAINRLRRIKIAANGENTSEQGNFKQSTSALESVEVSSEGNTLPAKFIFTCTPYIGMGQRKITCNLRAHTNNKITLSYRIVGASKLTQELTDEFCEVIKKQLTNKSTVTIGSIEYQGK